MDLPAAEAQADEEKASLHKPLPSKALSVVCNLKEARWEKVSTDQRLVFN